MLERFHDFWVSYNDLDPYPDADPYSEILPHTLAGLTDMIRSWLGL